MWPPAFKANVPLIGQARRLSYGLGLLFLFSGMSSGLPCTSALAQERPLTTREMRALSDADAKRAIERDLSSLLGPPDRSEWGRLRLLPHASVPMRPYGTAYEGLCRRDLLQIDYAPSGAASAMEDRPLQPFRVEIHAQFHALRAPVRFISQPGDIARVYERTAAARASDASCNALAADTKAGWFDAASEEKAAQAVNLLGATLNKIKAGTLAPNPCNIGGGAESCDRRVVRAVSPASLVGLTACVTTSNELCYEYNFVGGAAVKILYPPAEKDDDGPTPVSVSAGGYVTVH